MLIGNWDTFFPDMITDVITDLSDNPIRYETLFVTHIRHNFAQMLQVYFIYRVCSGVSSTFCTPSAESIGVLAG